jgi:hypothetical protein
MTGYFTSRISNFFVRIFYSIRKMWVHCMTSRVRLLKADGQTTEDRSCDNAGSQAVPTCPFDTGDADDRNSNFYMMLEGLH